MKQSKIVIELDSYINIDEIPLELNNKILRFLHQYAINAPLEGSLIIEFIENQRSGE